MSILKGKKSYIVAAAMLAYAVIGVVLGRIPNADAGLVILEALAVAGIRHGIAGVGKKK